MKKHMLKIVLVIGSVLSGTTVLQALQLKVANEGENPVYIKYQLKGKDLENVTIEAKAEHEIPYAEEDELESFIISSGSTFKMPSDYTDKVREMIKEGRHPPADRELFKEYGIEESISIFVSQPSPSGLFERLRACVKTPYRVETGGEKHTRRSAEETKRRLEEAKRIHEHGGIAMCHSLNLHEPRMIN